MIKPIGNRVLIKPEYDKTIGGIFLPSDMKRSSIRRFYGTVLSVSDELANELKAGDRVMFDDYGEKTVVDGEDCTLVGSDYILLKVVQP